MFKVSYMVGEKVKEVVVNGKELEHLKASYEIVEAISLFEKESFRPMIYTNYNNQTKRVYEVLEKDSEGYYCLKCYANNDTCIVEDSYHTKDKQDAIATGEKWLVY